MRKFLRILLIIVGVVVVLGLCGFVFIQVKGIPHYDVPKIEYKAEPTPERLERGKKLTLLLCANCHTNTATGLLTGEQMLDAPKEFGNVFSQNITQDKVHGIGAWTDAEIMYLLRTGIKRDGQYAPPYMVKLPGMADEDIASIIAFLRSDDPMMKAVATPDRPCEPTFLVKFLSNVAFKPLPMPTQPIPLPDTTNPVALGKYLVNNLSCFHCHSKDFKTNNMMEPEKSEGYLGGGNPTLDKQGNVILTQNLTPDEKTGIGEWTEDRFVKAVKFGISEDGHALRYPMVPYVQLTDYEAKSIYAYLRTVPPIVNNVPRSGL